MPGAWRSPRAIRVKHPQIDNHIGILVPRGLLPARADKEWRHSPHGIAAFVPGVCGAPIVTTIISESAVNQRSAIDGHIHFREQWNGIANIPGLSGFG